MENTVLKIRKALTLFAVVLYEFFFQFRKKGIIINISSLAADFPIPLHDVYPATKVMKRRLKHLHFMHLLISVAN